MGKCLLFLQLPLQTNKVPDPSIPIRAPQQSSCSPCGRSQSVGRVACSLVSMVIDAPSSQSPGSRARQGHPREDSGNQGERSSSRPLPLEPRQLPHHKLTVTALTDLRQADPRSGPWLDHLEKERAGLEMIPQNLASSKAPGSSSLSNKTSHWNGLASSGNLGKRHH